MYKQAFTDLASWIADGSLKVKYHVVDGLENAPSALPLLFNGGNTGKLCVFLPRIPVRCLLHSTFSVILCSVHQRLTLVFAFIASSLPPILF
jgi:hypothetical protein